MTTWVTAEVLKTLSARTPALTAGSQFTSFDLAEWTAGALTPEQRVHASSRLCALDFLRHSVELIKDAQRADVYRVTLAGAAAIEAARTGHVRKSGPKGERAPNPVKPNAFATRLWHLLRIRKMLTPAEGAELLTDAGDDPTAYERRRATARKCLRRWCDAGALTESARRIGPSGHSNGDKRYVLIVDSVEPPRWRQAAKAAKAGKGARA